MPVTLEDLKRKLLLEPEEDSVVDESKVRGPDPKDEHSPDEYDHHLYDRYKMHKRAAKHARIDRNKVDPDDHPEEYQRHDQASREQETAAQDYFDEIEAREKHRKSLRKFKESLKPGKKNTNAEWDEFDKLSNQKEKLDRKARGDLDEEKPNITPASIKAEHDLVVATLDRLAAKDTNKIKGPPIRLDYKKPIKEDAEKTKTPSVNRPKEPPPILLFKRRAIRMFPNGKRVALYYSDRVDKVLAIPYEGNFSGDDDRGIPTVTEARHGYEPLVGHRVVVTGYRKEKGTIGKVYRVEKDNSVHIKHEITGAKLGHFPLSDVDKMIGGHKGLRVVKEMKDVPLHEYEAELKQAYTDTNKALATAKIVGDVKEVKVLTKLLGELESEIHNVVKHVHDQNKGISLSGFRKKLTEAAKPKPKKKAKKKKPKVVAAKISNLSRIGQIARENGNGVLTFADGSKARIDAITAKAIHMVHGRINDENKMKLEKAINASKLAFQKSSAFCHGVHSQLGEPKAKKTPAKKS